MSSESPSTEFEFPECSVNISAAIEVLRRAEGGSSSRLEVNEMIGTLQELQKEGFNEPAIQIALTRLIAARPE